MADFVSSLGSLFSTTGGATSNLMKMLSTVMAGAGTATNVFSGIKGMEELNNLNNQQKAWQNLTPAQLTQKVLSAQKPLDQGLVQGVTNQVQGDVASRGLAQAPGIFAAEESQALAPFVQQNYNTALQQVMAQMQIPLQYAQAEKSYLPGQQNMSPLLKMLMQSWQQPSNATSGMSLDTPGGNTLPANIFGLPLGPQPDPSTGPFE
jgi:hypothetical protein